MFVVPSVYEPLGIVDLEAAACGTAVVASDVGGIPEVVDDGRTGPGPLAWGAVTPPPAGCVPAPGPATLLVHPPPPGGPP